MTNTTQQIRLTKSEIATVLGISTMTVDRWVKRGLLTQPEQQSTRLLFDPAIVRADVMRQRLKVNPDFLETPGSVNAK
jgi:predicted site-specific integrase-resolvase